MAIARDAKTHGGFSVASSHTFSFTMGSVSDGLMFVGCFGTVGAGTDDITGVTYNGVSMTLVDKAVGDTVARNSYLFKLANPPSGAHNVVITGGGTGGTDACGGDAWSYSGASGTIDSHSAGFGAVPKSQSTTVVASNCWTTAFCLNTGGVLDTPAGGTSVWESNADGLNILDSNGTVSTGSQSLGGDDSGGGRLAIVIASIAEPGGGGGSAIGPIVQSFARRRA